MEIRKTTEADIPTVMKIYDIGRQTMRNNGNDKQWINGFPQLNLIQEDVKKGISYVITQDDEVHGVFALIHGADPTYSYIEDGKWPDDEPYATIHRIASDGVLHGVVQAAVDFSFQQIDHLRIDTHELNKLMQHTVQKCGFKRCGVIYIADGSPRIAFAMSKK